MDTNKPIWSICSSSSHTSTLLSCCCCLASVIVLKSYVGYVAWHPGLLALSCVSEPSATIWHKSDTPRHNSSARLSFSSLLVSRSLTCVDITRAKNSGSTVHQSAKCAPTHPPPTHPCTPPHQQQTCCHTSQVISAIQHLVYNNWTSAQVGRPKVFFKKASLYLLYSIFFKWNVSCVTCSNHIDRRRYFYWHRKKNKKK